MKVPKNIKSFDEIGFIGTQPAKKLSATDEKKVAAKTKKAMDNYRNLHLGKKKVA